MNIQHKFRNNDLIKWFGKNTTMLYFSFAVMLLQCFHTSYVLADISVIGYNFVKWFQAVALAFVLEMFIIVYVIRGNKPMSKLFAAFSMLVNGYYYYIGHGFTLKFFVGCAFSIMIPLAVYYASEEIMRKMELKR